MAAKHYRELIVWQRAMDLAEQVYKATASFPREELFGITTQLRRAAVSVPSNIAEGQGRDTIRDFLHFLAISRGSLQELETQLLIGERLGYLHPEEAARILGVSAEVGRVLNGLCRAIANA